MAMLWHVKKAFSEILDEILGKSTTDEPSCKELREPEDKLCTYAHMAMKGDKEAEDAIRRFITLTLSSAGVPRDLLDRANTRQLIEVYAPATSMGQFILLLRALALAIRTWQYSMLKWVVLCLTRSFPRGSLGSLPTR